jgi:hypothetical protein
VEAKAKDNSQTDVKNGSKPAVESDSSIQSRKVDFPDPCRVVIEADGERRGRRKESSFRDPLSSQLLPDLAGIHVFHLQDDVAFAFHLPLFQTAWPR